MVGVPGRSKACNTCKQRKVACTLEKPECRTCVKASRVCTGYQRERIFIIEQGATYEAPKPKLKDCAESGDVPRARRRNASVPLHLHKNNIKNSQKNEIQAKTLSRITCPSTRSVFRDRILDEFLSNFLPARYGDREKSYAGNWLPMIPSIPDLTAALEASILAVSTATLGRLTNNQVLLHESVRLYGKGLWELQRALWSPKLMYRDETLAACMSLITYEVLECPDKTISGWMSHMKGCAKLFELKGPNAYSSEFGRQLFFSFRLIEIQQAFAERRSTYLASPEWIDVPFGTRSKPTLHQLLDIMALISSIVGEGYKTLTAPVEGSQKVDPKNMLLTLLELMERCWKMDSKLRKFYAELEGSTLGPVFWPELVTDGDLLEEDPELGKVFPVSFQFFNLRMAHICILYWATTSILWSGMAYAYQLIAGVQMAIAQSVLEAEDGSTHPITNFHTTQLPPLKHRQDAPAMARNICQSMEYCLKDEHRGMGARAATFPLKVSIETLHDAPGCEREALWAQATMERIEKKGVRIMGHLGAPITDHVLVPG